MVTRNRRRPEKRQEDGRGVFEAIGDTRQCYNCGAVDHTRLDYPDNVKRSGHADAPSDTKGKDRRFAMAVSPIA